MFLSPFSVRIILIDREPSIRKMCHSKKVPIQISERLKIIIEISKPGKVTRFSLADKNPRFKIFAKHLLLNGHVLILL